jgi:hypothetical protein
VRRQIFRGEDEGEEGGGRGRVRDKVGYEGSGNIMVRDEKAKEGRGADQRGLEPSGVETIREGDVRV